MHSPTDEIASLDATLRNKALTAEQDAVVQRLLKAKGIHALDGTPGSGKTFTTKW